MLSHIPIEETTELNSSDNDNSGIPCYSCGRLIPSKKPHIVAEVYRIEREYCSVSCAIKDNTLNRRGSRDYVKLLDIYCEYKDKR